MIIAFAITAIVAIFFGISFGRIARSVTRSLSVNFRVYGPFLAGVFGAVVAFFAAFNGATPWSFVCIPALGVIVAILTCEVVYRKSR